METYTEIVDPRRGYKYQTSTRKAGPRSVDSSIHSPFIVLINMRNGVSEYIAEEVKWNSI